MRRLSGRRGCSQSHPRSFKKSRPPVAIPVLQRITSSSVIIEVMGTVRHLSGQKRLSVNPAKKKGSAFALLFSVSKG